MGAIAMDDNTEPGGGQSGGEDFRKAGFVYHDLCVFIAAVPNWNAFAKIIQNARLHNPLRREGFLKSHRQYPNLRFSL